MARLWTDISHHPRATAGFAAVWIAVWAMTAFTWTGGLSTLTMLLQTVLPFAAGALVGCWRLMPSEHHIRPCGMLAGGLVTFLNITLVFFVDWAHGPTSPGTWEWDVFGLWLVIAGTFAMLGAFLGFVGGVAAQAVLIPPHREAPPA